MGIVYWSPLSIFVSLNKELESGGGPKFMLLFYLLEGALKILLVLRGGQRKNITVEFLLSPPCTINNEQSLTSNGAG